jgi:hypothetical protein
LKKSDKKLRRNELGQRNLKRILSTNDSEEVLLIGE